MGISGLLPLLKEITVSGHVKDWKGKTLAVDAYVWLHRGAYGCAQELATGKPTIKYVNYAMHRVRMLKYYGVTPYVVFDGGLLPSKMGTEGDRERKRNEALAKGNAFLAEGKSNQARECFVKAVDVTPAMAYQLIKALRQEGIQYVVAPYEADPQLAYLEKKGLVDGIITEDSDLLVFGCRNVLFKLDGDGNCSAVSRDDFTKCREYNFSDWSDVEFRQMAILSGCDYLESIQGLGLKTAYRLMRKYKTAEKVIQFVRLEGQLTVPRNYVEEFRRAELTFLHQRVFDPVERQLVHFCPLPEGRSASEMPFVGAELDREYACGLADGDIDPLSKQAMVDLVPDSFASTTAPRTTYKSSVPAPAANSQRGSSSKPPVQPAKGAASILNFFSRAPASPSPLTTSINPVKNVANQKRVHLLSGTVATREAVNAASPKRKSRFFGSKVGEQKSERKEEVAHRDDEPGTRVLVGAESPGPDEGDEDAELALREIELEAALGGESVHTKSPRGPDIVQEQTPPAQGGVGAQLDTPPRERSPTPCLSSPLETTPRATRPSTSPTTRAHPASDDALAISSPVSSTHADAGWEEPSISSPPREPNESVSPALVRPASRAAGTTPHQSSERKRSPEVVELSSDPIDAPTSDLAAARRPRVMTPRPRKTLAARNSSSQEDRKPVVRKPKTSKSKASSTIRVRPDSGSNGDEAKRAVGDLEDDDGEDTAMQSVAASWRAKFMLQNASASRVPAAKTTAHKCAPSPRVEPASASNPLRSGSLSRDRIPLSPRSTTNRSSKPPSPIVLVGVDRDDDGLDPRSPKRRKAPSSSSSSSTCSTSPEMEDSTPLPKRATAATAAVVEPLELHTGSSSPILITNPKLLAFRFKG